MVYGRALLGAGEVKESLEIAFENRRAALELTDIGLQVTAWTVLADALMNTARFREAIQMAEEGLARFPRHIPSEDSFFGLSPYSILSLNRGVPLCWTGWLSEGLEELSRCRRLAEEDGTPELVGWAVFYTAEAYHLAHDADRALASARQLETISRALGEPPLFVALAKTAFGFAHLTVGRAADAIEPLRAALETHRDIERYRASDLAALLAEALLQNGDLSAAQLAAEEAVALCRRVLRGQYEAIAHGVMARALMRRDGAAAREAVEAALAAAAELIERTGAKTLAPALCEWRAELAGILGDDAARAQLIREAHQGYLDIGAPGHAERIATTATA
jgi:tetratricopeptide (TPR) repeat protein